MDEQYMHDVPEVWEAALILLSHAIEDAHGINPGNNSAERFNCPVFQMAAYDWGEDRDWNFRWRGIEVIWYKYMGRGMSANTVLTTRLALDMIAECLPAAYGDNLAG